MISELPYEPPVLDYNWAVDALVEALSLFNKGEPGKAEELIRSTLWREASRCMLSP